MYQQLIITLLLTIQFKSTSSQSCLQPATSGQAIELNPGGSNVGLPNNTQAIITSYQFGADDCCGDITAWEAAVHPFGSIFRNGGYTIHFQVWRPSPTVESDGCYSLVGENRFTSITFSNDILTATPAATNRISFRPNDVIGFLSITNTGNQNAGITFDRDLDSETVWYHTGASDSEPLVAGGLACPYPVGSTRTLTSFTNQGPAVFISYETSDCTSLSPTTTEDTILPTTTEDPLQPTNPGSSSSRVPDVQPTPPVLVSITHLPTQSVSAIADVELNPTVIYSPSQVPVSPPTSGSVIGVAVAVCVLAVIVVASIAAIVMYRKRAGKGKLQQRLDLLELSYNINYIAAGHIFASADGGVKATKMKATAKATKKKRTAGLVQSMDELELSYNRVYGGARGILVASASESYLHDAANVPVYEDIDTATKSKSTAKKQSEKSKSMDRLELIPNAAYTASTSTIASTNQSHDVTTSAVYGSDSASEQIKAIHTYNGSKALVAKRSKSEERLDLPTTWSRPLGLKHSISADNVKLTSNVAYSSNTSIAISDVDSKSVERLDLPPKPLGLRHSISADNVKPTSNVAYSSSASIAISDIDSSDHAYEEIVTASKSKIHGKKHVKLDKNVDRSLASRNQGKKSSGGVKKFELPARSRGLGQQHSKSMELLPITLEPTSNAAYTSSTTIVISDSEGHSCGEAGYHAYEEIQTPKKPGKQFSRELEY